MTRGAQPRPLRHSGRLNRRGRNRARIYVWRTVQDDRLPKHARADEVRDLFLSGRLTIDPPDGAR